MKLLVVGESLGPEATRLRLAAQGLALRGHEVLWTGPLGSNPPTEKSTGDQLGAQIRHVSGGLHLARLRAEQVLGSGSPARIAWAGWLASAYAMALGLDDASMRRWSAFDRWCWESLDAVGLRESGDSNPAPRLGSEMVSQRITEWSRVDVPAVPDAAHPDTEILERLCERSRSRIHGGNLRAAVFLDRDGTLVVEKNYLASPDGLELLDGVPEALRRLQAEGYALVVISNQAGVGRGLFPLSRVYQTMAALRIQLRQRGLELDGIYFCPHRPDEGCACRKPGTALLERAAADLDLDLRRSVMIGDRLLDVITGQRAGARSILVRTGYGTEEEEHIRELERLPDRICRDLSVAAAWLLERGGPRDSE